jgi:hypothetical protein
MLTRILLSGAVIMTLAIGILTTGSAHAGNGHGKGNKDAGDSYIALSSGDGTTAAVTAEPSLGSDVSFDSYAAGLAGWEDAMVALSCYQDVNGDGVIDTNLLGPDVVYTWLDTPDASFQLGAYSSIWTLRGGGDAECRADLDAYGWKGGKQSIRVLASVSFHADG